MNSYTTALCVVIGFFYGVFPCEFPEAWQERTWTDDSDRKVTFSTDVMSGFGIAYYSTVVETWKCFLRDGDVFVLRGGNEVTSISESYHAYICMVSQIYNDTTFSYILYSPKATQALYQRVVVSKTSLNASFCDVCSGADDLTENDVTVMAEAGDPCMVQPSSDLECTICSSRCNPTSSSTTQSTLTTTSSSTSSTTTPTSTATTTATSSTTISTEATTTSTTTKLTTKASTLSTTLTIKPSALSTTSTDAKTTSDQSSDAASTSGQSNGQKVVILSVDSSEVVLLVFAVGLPLLLMLIVVIVGFIVVLNK